MIVDKRDQIKIKNDVSLNENDNESKEDGESNAQQLEYWETRIIREVYDLFCDRMGSMLQFYTWHSNVKYVQHKSRDYLIDNMPDDVLGIGFDYIQNIDCVEHLTTMDAYQKSVECSYFQLNLFWKQNNILMKGSFQLISSDSKHDTSSAIASLDLWFEKCWSSWDSFKQVEMWSDNSPKEFGSARFIHALAQFGEQYDFCVSKNYTAIYDGKWWCDNEGSVNKGYHNRGVRSGAIDYTKPEKNTNSNYHACEIVRYLNEQHWLHRETSSMMRCAMVLERKRIKHTKSNIRSLKHFKQHHCFRQVIDNETGDKQVYMRLLTCYCTYCITGQISEAAERCIHFDICGPWKRVNFVIQGSKKDKKPAKPNEEVKQSSKQSKKADKSAKNSSKDGKMEIE